MSSSKGWTTQVSSRVVRPQKCEEQVTSFSYFQGSSSRMSSVIRSEAIEVLEEEPVTSKTYDHPLKSDPIPVEVCSKSPASLEMIQRVSEERIHPGSSPKMGGNCDLIHQEGLQSRSLHLSPQEQSPDRQDKSQSWRRASMKEISRRKSLPAFHQGITELSRSISANLAESKRLGALLLSSFQFSVQKLEPFLKDMEGFSLESFRAKASSLSEELKHFAESLESNGTLQKCFEDSKGKASDLSLETSVAEMKEYITKFSLERQSWDQLLQHYQMEAEEITSRTSAETKVTEVEVEPKTYLGSSQSEVLSTKPDYQKILQNQNKVFDYMELVMDELQGSVKQLHAFMDESTQCFQKVSVQLGKRSTQQLDPSPARKLLKLQLQNPPTTHCSRSCQ
ncbi:kinetochore-associated protein DSN1 homolog isoform X3 [Canis lupus baileyi]|uniref:DSN1 component of MIS12 kinetochore complex n=1 Tax=Canis lupus familiaris TaxID=9615 RepID=A0A8P0SDM3_CANLF|nr:kinetochore-associated protein DSN1 homolog isoform X3 [Canis lupus familiaris]XP_025325757.1 kinetochore-associated protein DSN1 homolog isoform X3 [Canis lupus dingo]XP_038289664.1 kinetochore-associated protein DSN1 homolog isoform X3 [Canis lupus familiaris]XP_038428145.1 kinetochore-associated protein DSN1 homolog isoform X3 [Canis lupus familiaris]